MDPWKAQKEIALKNESRKLATSSTPNTHPASSVRSWLASRRPAWLGLNSDADSGPTSTTHPEHDSLIRELALLKSGLESENQAKAQALEALAEQQNQRAQAEEERLALSKQLHQLQEDLEHIGLINKTLLTESHAIDQERATLARQNQTLAQQNAGAIAARDAEVEAKAEALEQRELEANAKADAQLKLEVETDAKTALQKEKTALVQDKWRLSQEITTLKSSLESEAKAKSQITEQLAHEKSLRSQADEEGELLLAQLHQVQEELERYYLTNKDLQSNLRQAQARFGRVASRQPDGIDWETVQIEPLTVDGKPALQCRAVNVAVIGKEWKTLDFLAFNHDGVISFGLERGEDASGTGPLTRWPRACEALPTFTVRLGQDAYDESNLNSLRGLSTSDWDLVRGLPRLVSTGLQSTPAPWPVGHPDVAAWQNAVQATPPVLNDLPVALRYDRFNIQGAAVLPGYENLQIQFSHLGLGQKRFENFEFRFACNLTMQGEFGANARLEFFKLNGVPVFEQWAPNYRDGQSERLDLVFVFPSTLNLKEFSALSINDRALVLLLADLLPSLLADANPNGLTINRPFEEWAALAQKLRSFVRARLDVMGVQKQPGALVDAVTAGLLVQGATKTKGVSPKLIQRHPKTEILKFRKR